MSSGVRAILLALIVLAIGLGTVYLEVETLECGVRVRQLYMGIDVLAGTVITAFVTVSPR